LANANVDAVVVNDRRCGEIAAFAPGDGEFSAFGVRIELPNQVAPRREGVEPAIAAGEDDLRLAVDDGGRRVRPLAVVDEFAAIDELLEDFNPVRRRRIETDGLRGRRVILPHGPAG